MKKDFPKIYIIDVTNRDGVQTSRILLSKLAKTMINIYLDEMGVYQSEIGFPVLKHEKNYINANLELVKKGVIKRLHLEGWCRAVEKDVRSAFENTPDIKHLNLSVSTSDIMIKGKFQGKRTWSDIIKSMVEALKSAEAHGAETIGVNAEDASRTETERLIEFALAAKENGASRFRYCDTIGGEDPFSVAKRVSEIVHTSKLPVEMHCHNDLGMAEAVSAAGAIKATEAGVDAFINTTINGYGERAGNCDLVSTLLAFRYSPGFVENAVLDKHINLKWAWKICKYTSYAYGLPIPINHPGIGSNVFAHESGIHADGVLKDSHNYELFSPEEVGRGEPELIETGRVITTGEYGGLKGFRHVYDKLGIHFLNDNEARHILELVQYANLHTQKPLTDDELIFIAKYPDVVNRILTVCI